MGRDGRERLRDAVAISRFRVPVRSADAEQVDVFFVAAVATILLIRIFLEVAGYPRIGGGGVHIAHVLWGGLGMLVAIVLLLSFRSPGTRVLGAAVGGAGFGAFVDELGKFVTSDNDYFFRPTAALLYVLFVMLFLALREVRRFRELSPEEKLVNAVELSEGIVTDSLSAGDRDRALALLDGADQRDPMVALLRDRFNAARPTAEGTLLSRLGAWASRSYERAAESSWFRRLIAFIFIVEGVGFVANVVAVSAALIGATLGIAEARAAVAEATAGSDVIGWIQVFATVVAGLLIVAGVALLRRSRSRAYRAFELAILVDLLIAKPFAFLETGFAASLDVLIDLALLATLRYLDAEEERLMPARVAAAESPAVVSG